MKSLLSVLSLLTGLALHADERPNLVVIYVDDLDFEEVGVYEPQSLALETRGPLGTLTPAIDRLANDGMRFTNGFVTSSICTPSRYSVLTGKFASRSVALQTDPNSTWRDGRTYPPGGPGNIHFNAKFLPGEQTIGHLLQRAGYTTGYTGKWHLGTSDQLYRSPKLQFNGADPDSREGQAVIRAHYEQQVAYVRDNFGFDYVDGFYSDNARALGNHNYPEPYRDHNPEWMTAKALEFLDQVAGGDKPFFLYYALTLPHGEGWSLVDTLKEANPLKTPAGILDAPPGADMPPRETLIPRVREAGLPPVAAGMLWVDDAVGALMRKLSSLGVAENTLVLFISDHGNGAKCALQDGGVNIPFTATWPAGIPAGSVSDALVANIDVLPTAEELAGVEPGENIDGLSMLPVFRDPAADLRDSLYLEVGYARGVVTKDWKYIALRFPADEWAYIQSLGGIQEVNTNASPASKNFREAGMKNYPHYYDLDQLYHRAADPTEQVNLFGNPEYAEKQAEMIAKLTRLLNHVPHSFGELKPAAQTGE